MKKNNYNLQIFKSIREEINMRIGIHYKLILSKIVLSSGLFSYLQNQSHLMIYPFFLASICSFALDIIIIENLGWIRGAGNFIKNHIETSGNKIIKWETNYTQSGGNWVCFTPIGYILGVWMFSLFWFLGGMLYQSGPTSSLIYYLYVIIILFLIFYTLFLIRKHLFNKSLYQRETSPIE